MRTQAGVILIAARLRMALSNYATHELGPAQTHRCHVRTSADAFAKPSLAYPARHQQRHLHEPRANQRILAERQGVQGLETSTYGDISSVASESAPHVPVLLQQVMYLLIRRLTCHLAGLRGHHYMHIMQPPMSPLAWG